jgi:H+-translocating NAD(P) transhydrogenase subunit alpha
MMHGMKPRLGHHRPRGRNGWRQHAELSKPGENVEVGSVLICAPLNIPSLLAEHASELYAKNLLNFLELIVVEGELKLDWEDEIVAQSVLTHDGEIKNEAAKAAVETN